MDLDEEPRRGNDSEVVAAGRRRLGEAMADGCGIVREGERLQQTQTVIREIRDSLRAPAYGVDELELFNLLTVAEHMVESALMREESRGVHLRSDFPQEDDGKWRRHVLLHGAPRCDTPVITLSPLEE